MMKRLIALVLVAWPLAATANLTNVSKMPAYLPVPKGAAVILNTGSTNASGYRVVVQEDGAAEYAAPVLRVASRVPSSIAAKFFSDLRAASRLHELPHASCMKSVSFGTSLFVWWDHSRSPDLTCPSDARGKALEDDAQAIASALHIGNGRRGPVMRPLMPGEQHEPLPPTPTPSM
jgi:hypothetical protein